MSDENQNIRVDEEDLEKIKEDWIQEIIDQRVEEKTRELRKEIEELKEDTDQNSSTEKDLRPSKSRISRREFLKKAGLGFGGLAALASPVSADYFIKDDSLSVQTSDTGDASGLTEGLFVDQNQNVEIPNGVLNIKGSRAATRNWSNDQDWITESEAPVQDVNGSTGSISVNEYSDSKAADAAPVQSVNGQTGDVETAEGADFNRFTSDGTWNKPDNVDFIKVDVIGSGGDGGNGDSSTGSSAGSGGGGGARVLHTFPASLIDNSVSVTVGTGGSDSSFGSLVTATGGNNGSYSGGGGGSGGNSVLDATYDGGNGGGDRGRGGSSVLGAGGGAGGHSTSDGDKGGNTLYVQGGSGGTAEGGNGSDGGDSPWGTGSGGGGGAEKGGDGGDGGVPGGGGGGGGDGSGAGGNGARGEVRVWAW